MSVMKDAWWDHLADSPWLEGDVEGVMDRPIGNTPEVHAECEKW